jgi:hypothetical protein
VSVKLPPAYGSLRQYVPEVLMSHRLCPRRPLLTLCELESTEISTNAILPLKTDTFTLSQKVVPTAMMMYEPGGN